MNRQDTQQLANSKANGVSEPLLDKTSHRDAFVLDHRLMTLSPKSGESSPILSRDGKAIRHQGSVPIPRSSSLGQATLSTYKLANNSNSKPQFSQHGQGVTPASTRKNQHANTLGQSPRGRQLLSLSPKLSLRHSFKSSTSSVSSNSSSAQSLGSMTSVSSADDARSFKFRQTHVAAYSFIARHEDEISFDVGDAIQVEKKYDDLWFEGMNLRTGGYGIFPSRYVSDVLSKSPSPTPSRRKDVGVLDLPQVDCQQFFLRFLGSIEVNDFKGNEVICEAMREIAKKHQMTSSSSKPVHCSVEVSVQGVKVVDFGIELPQGKKQNKLKLGKLFEKEQKDYPEHFFALKNVTFCGCHPQNPRYFAFITKHPDDRRFACHVFMSENSTEPVARAIGEVFKEFYAQFLDQTAMAEEFPDVGI